MEGKQDSKKRQTECQLQGKAQSDPGGGCSGSQEEGQGKAGQGQPEQPEASRKPPKDSGQGSTPSDLMEMFFWRRLTSMFLCL